MIGGKKRSLEDVLKYKESLYQEVTQSKESIRTKQQVEEEKLSSSKPFAT